ncbi:MAG: magnesium transporter [Oscillospiraceae bacterium]|nr:MAG: magnesium transporter [Oscillospiraceae bacterium]
MTELKIEELLDMIGRRDVPAIKAYFADQNPIDIAELLSEDAELPLAKLYRLLPKTLAAEVFVEMDSDTQAKLIAELSDKEIAETMSELFYDDAADLVEEMPATVVKRILKNTATEDRSEINKLLKFKDDSAGSIMTTEFVELKREMTVGEALDHIRRVAPDKETVYTCYVTDGTRHLLGLVTALALLTSPTDKKIGDLMNEHVISARTSDDREEVAKTLTKYDFLALPVVDSEDRLVGIVTVDDALDVISEETEEDFAKMAGMSPSEAPYLKTPALRLFRARIPWLLLLMVSATFTGMIISGFENALAKQVVLTMFIPMLMDTGGNSGSQSSVTIIRALSLGDVRFGDILRVLRKELTTALLCGVTLAAVAFVKLMTVDNLLSGGVTLTVALVVSLTLLCTVLAAKFIGATLPLIVHKVGLDPAVAASPMITTIVDAIALLVYFAIATALLGL